MKHRRVVGGPKKKNRIQEVSATTADEGSTSPLESPFLGDDDGSKGAVQRFLTQRRAQRVAEESDDEFPNDDDEPDNDSGDEGLTRRKQFFLDGGTVLPSALPPPPPPITPPPPSLPPRAPNTHSQITDNSSSSTNILLGNGGTTTANATATATATTSAMHPTPLKSNQHPDTRFGLPKPDVHPLRRAVSSDTPLLPTTPTPSYTGEMVASPHHRAREPSVSFSLQTTDMESGQPLPDHSLLGSLSLPSPQTERTPLLSPSNNLRELNLPPAAMGPSRQEEEEGNDDDDDMADGSFHSAGDSTLGDKGENTTAADNQTAFTGSILEQFFEEGTQAVYDTLAEATTEAWEQYDESCHYDWKEFWKGGGFVKFVRWLATGMTPENYKQSDDEIQENLNGLARTLSLLREYHERFGMPEIGGFKDQEYVLREVTKDLYLGGSPIWALEPVMKRVAEGLTGKRGVDFFMLPRRAFIFAPSSGATVMFRIDRGYDMQRLDDMESIAVRMASFASNTSSVASVPTRWPKPQEMRRAFRTESLADCYYSKEDMADEILNLASDAEGLFFYIRNHQSKCYANRESPLYSKGDDTGKLSELGEFWTVEEDIRELFSRLAAVEAAKAIDNLDASRKALYSPLTVVMFRVLASACDCAFWFKGSWLDTLVSGILAQLVAMIGSSPLLSKQERIIFEAVASFIVGFTAAAIAISFPDECCFGAMAISGVLDLLQGFRIVYSIIEIMSRHTVTGGADFLEGVFFTCLIAYCLKFGQYVALQTMGEPTTEAYMQCNKGVSEWWYLLLVPVGAVAWSGLFNPHYFDLPIMAAHGILGYVISWQFNGAAANTQMNNFLAAMTVTFSAGIVSRFTGRQALGNTVAGLYVLLPGAYLVTQVYTDQIDHFLWTIVLRAIIIGLGGWTGTILCTPTLLGINKGLMEYSKAAPTLVEHGQMRREDSAGSSIASGQNFRRRDKAVRKTGTGRLLFF